MIALEAVWADIRRRHPDVPTVIVTVGAGSIGTPRGTLRLGHYAHARWHPAAPAGEAPAVAELFIAGEGLAHGPVELLGTLLHEAAHGIAATRQIKDTSRAGAYHNKRFKALAEELGLRDDRDPTIGWSLTTVPAQTAAAHAAQIEQLRAAIAHVRASEHKARQGGHAGAPNGDGSDPSQDGTAGTRSAPTIRMRLPAAAATAHGAHRLRARRRHLRRLRAALHRRLTATVRVRRGETARPVAYPGA